MADKARKKTDQELKKLEREIYELYATASSDLYEKWHKYMQSHKKKLDSAYDTLQEAKKSGDRDVIKAAQEEYERTFKNITLNDERYKAMINETTAKMAHVNEIALGYVNDETPKVYTLNYNAFSDEKIDGYDFTLVNERAVKNLIESDKIELPPKKVDIPKDQRWNAKNLNSQLMQGILQGENISKIAKRLQNVTDMNRNSAIRNARTMVTGAENKGRQDSFKKAESDGVIMKRRWVATHDERTRAWHSDLDGQEVGLDEPWENDYGEIMYPGDPTADPANVYNCRCSIRAIVQGFAWNQEKEEVTDIPETLKDYEKTYNEFKEKRTSQIEDMRPFEDMDKLLNNLVKNNEFRMRIPTDNATVLRSILTDGKFKTQFETSSSKGAYSPDRRRHASENLFGTKNIADSQYEKYGYLGSKNLVKDDSPMLFPYGNGIITFNKKSMMDRTTLTVGDSLRESLGDRLEMGTKVTNIDSTVAIAHPEMAKPTFDALSNYVDKYGIDDASHASFTVGYFELQYHGDLTLSDVDTMTIDKFILDEVFSDSSLKEKAKKAGIKFNYIIGDDVVDYDLD